MSSLSKESKIIIIGSGVFGLTSALHLVKSGYKNITIFDRLDLYKLRYSFEEGADTASADINKVFRACYDGEVLYHNLALRAKEMFLKWDKEIGSLEPKEAKEKFNIEGNLKIIHECGMLVQNNEPEMTIDLINSMQEFIDSGLRDTQYDLNIENDMERAKKNGLYDRADFFKVLTGEHPYFKKLNGIYDSTAGILFANNCCLYVHAFLRSNGVKFITGIEGTVKSLLESTNSKTIEGILTIKDDFHQADLTIVACGPWSGTLIPELSGLSEAQNGNVVCVKIPDNKKDLIKKYSSENFPLTVFRSTSLLERFNFSGLGAFPIINSNNLIKFIIRQRKYTNPTTLGDGSIVSVPITTRSNPPESRLSKHIINQVKDYIKVFFPDLVEFGIHCTRMLWYTDTINNDFIIDHVPGKRNCMVVTGGSGHGFKFLPVLGEYVVDVIENRKNQYTEKFKWRDPKSFEDINEISKVVSGESDYKKQQLANEDDLKFTNDEINSFVNTNPLAKLTIKL